MACSVSSLISELKFCVLNHSDGLFCNLFDFKLNFLPCQDAVSEQCISFAIHPVRRKIVVYCIHTYVLLVHTVLIMCSSGNHQILNYLLIKLLIPMLMIGKELWSCHFRKHQHSENSPSIL